MNARGRYTLYGALFGAIFPLLAFLIIQYLSKDIWLLFGMIATAPLFLGLLARSAGKRSDQVAEINRKLEDNIAQRVKAIQSLIDVSGQGFLSFDASFKVGPEYSRECEAIFGQVPAGKQIDELLYRKEEDRSDFRNGLKLFFKGKVSPDVVFDIMEPRLSLGERTLSLSFKEISPQVLMLIMTDISSEVKAAEQSRVLEQQRQMVLKAVSNRRAFTHLMNEADELMVELREPLALIEDKLRLLHTFKGNAGFLGLIDSQDKAHELEEYIQDSLVFGSSEQMDDLVSDLEATFIRERDVVRTTLGDDIFKPSDLVEVSHGNWVSLEAELAQRHPEDKDLHHRLYDLRKVPVSRLTERFPYLVKDMGSRLGKRLHDLKFVGGDTRVDGKRLGPLVSTFAHILRNQVDHGIESPHEREELGKPAQGQLTIETENRNGTIIFRLSDDGRGIAFDKVAAKARELGLLPQGAAIHPQKMVSFLFRHDFSTSSTVSTISGRGIGLSVVHQAVRVLGGHIKVKSIAGQGTTFEITVPPLSVARRGK